MRVNMFCRAAGAGLLCGLAVRLCLSLGNGDTAPARAVPGTGPEVKSSTEAVSAAPEKWEARLSAQLGGAMPGPGSGAGGRGPRAEAAALLRMARTPVSAASIQEGVELLNTLGADRFAWVMAAVFVKWAKEAPEEALSAAGELRDPGAKMALVWKVFEKAAASGEPDLLTKAADQPAGVARSAALQAIVESLSPDRIPEMLRKSLEELPPPGAATDSLQEKLLRKLVESDGEAPLRLALETENPAWRASLIRAALSMSRGDDPDWRTKFRELAADRRNIAGLTYHMSVAMRGDPAAMLPILAGWPEGKRREILTDVFSGAFERLPEGVFRPGISAEGIDALIRDTEAREGADGFRGILAEAALRKGAQGLDETEAWLTARGDTAGVEDLTRRAALREPFTTARWLAAMAPSMDRDRAVAAFAEAHAAADAERSVLWAESIADPVIRDTALKALRVRLDGKSAAGGD